MKNTVSPLYKLYCTHAGMWNKQILHDDSPKVENKDTPKTYLLIQSSDR